MKFNTYHSKKNSMLWPAVFILLGFLLCNVKTYSIHSDPNGKLQFKKITSIQGLSNNTVFDITQDTEGFIWIATREGLNKFDGQTVTSYYHNGVSSIPGNIVVQLLVTSTGSLFVGTQKGIGIYQKLSDSFSNLLYKHRSLGDVERIIELSYGHILVATSEGLYRIDKDLNVNQISNLHIRDMCEFKAGIIWALSDEEILLLNMEGDIIRKYSNDNVRMEDFDMSSDNIECIYKDSRGVIWLGTQRDGIGYYDYKTDKFFNLKLQAGVNPIEDNFIRVINEDNIGRLWIGTESGLYIYDIDKQVFQFHGQSFSSTDMGLNDKAIYSIFRCRNDMMWIGTYFGGVNYTSLYQKGFNRIYADGGWKGLSGNAVSEIIETADNKLWIATEDGGISIFNPEDETFEYLKHLPDDPSSLSSNNVHALEEDDQGNIWIGTFIGGLNRYNAKTKKNETIKLVPPAENVEEDVYSRSLFSVFIDSKKRIWVGSINGLYMKETERDEFKIWNPAVFQDNFIYHIEEDPSGNIWICSYEQGIFRIDTQMKVLNYRTGSNRDILSDGIVFCFFDSRDLIWFGTVEGGLLKYDPSRDIFVSYTESEGLPNNTVYAIAEDLQCNLWLSTNRGLSMFNPDSEVFVNYSENDGLIGNQFNFKSGLKASNGIIYFGAVNGLSYFIPQTLRKDEHKPVVHFTDLKISNNTVNIGDNDILSSHIDFLDEIHLQYRHKVFTIDFVALNYLTPKNTEYAYYLEGLEEDWNYVGSRQSATYTNLSPGSYVFHLKASNGIDVWSEEDRTITLHISPPFWTSTWGFVLYGFILFSSVLLIIKLYHVRQKEKMNIRIAQMEKQKNEEIGKHRLNFFTYISHEFKTPLTLIIATLEHIMHYEDILPRFKDYGVLMRKNAMRLLFLINQLMDFRKIETDHAALIFNKGDLVGFIKSTFESFNPLMKKSSVDGKFFSNVDSYIVYFDADKMEKILTNLLSNACKSFQKPGTISVDVKISEKSHLANPSSDKTVTGDLIMSVIDDGPGLPPEKLEQIFEPFKYTNPADQQGSGIGLSLVKSLVNYMNGRIDITNRPGGGTKAIIQLPLVHNPLPELIQSDRFIDRNTSFNPENTSIYFDSDPAVTFEMQDSSTIKNYELLIVEDNIELASFLSHHFSSVFKVHIAYDGKQALDRIKKSHPDLIISDIMMPHMDGFALCNAVKDTLETSHIPVILLTSKTGDDSRIEGLYKGADAYVDKPFNLKELDLRIRNILKSRENLRKHFAKFASMPETMANLSNKDQMFINKLTDIVYAHLDDGSFNVDSFCQEVTVSRTLMHMKLKKITGMSTTEFIKNIRLTEAKKMLQEDKLTVSEIAYRVGFNDPAYFSKSFKKLFDKPPSAIAIEIS